MCVCMYVCVRAHSDKNGNETNCTFDSVNKGSKLLLMADGRDAATGEIGRARSV